MIEITNAWPQKGWSNRDHLIDDEPVIGLIGQDFETPKSAAKAFESAAPDLVVTFEYADSRGEAFRYDNSPYVPGRTVQRITKI